MNERRRDARFTAALLSHITITLRPGHSVMLIDLGPGGALVHSMRPLRPGGRVHVLLASEAGAVQTVAEVLRCAVVSIHATDGATYGGALQFDTRCVVPWEPATRRG